MVADGDACDARRGDYNAPGWGLGNNGFGAVRGYGLIID
jgi:hypothetical protein